MSTAEITAYLFGSDLCAAGGSIVRLLLCSRVTLAGLLEADQLAALDKLGHDRWAHWVRRGWDDRAREIAR